MSLARRTTLAALLASGLAIAGSGVLAWVVVRTMAWSTLDHHLTERLGQLQGLVRVRGGSAHFPPGTLVPERGERVILRDPTGTVLIGQEGGPGPFRVVRSTWMAPPFAPPGWPGTAEGPAMELTLEVGQATSAIDADLHRLALILMITGVVALGTTGVLVHRFHRAALRPVDDLVAAIAAIDPSTGDGQTPLTGLAVPRELAAVPERLQELLGRVQATLRRERQTAATIAHELRTPVAALKATVDFARLRPPSTSADAEDWDACRALVATLEDTITRLLLLSRLERGVVEPVLVRQPLAPVVDAVAATVEPNARDRAMTLAIAVPADLAATCDQALLALILRSLVANAVQHGRRGTSITLEARDLSGAVALICRNAAQDPIRATAACSAAEAGPGLGLPLVRRLAEVQGAVCTPEVAAGEFIVTVRLRL